MPRGRKPSNIPAIGTVFTYLKVDSASWVQSRRSWVWCICKCGERKAVRVLALWSKNTKSCGCLQREKVVAKNFRHGMSLRRTKRSPEYAAWVAIRMRCSNPKSKAWKYYGGRGITVCARWVNSFESFFGDMGIRPLSKTSVDRRDNDKGYWCGKAECPECGPLGREPNCRWADDFEQANNTRHTRWMTHNGVTLTLTGWAKRIGISPASLHGRLNRMSQEEALSMPAQPDSRVNGWKK